MINTKFIASFTFFSCLFSWLLHRAEITDYLQIIFSLHPSKVNSGFAELCVYRPRFSLYSTWAERELYSRYVCISTKSMRVCIIHICNDCTQDLYMRISSRTRDPLPHLVSAGNKRLITPVVYCGATTCVHLTSASLTVPSLGRGSIRRIWGSVSNFRSTRNIRVLFRAKCNTRVLNVRDVITVIHYKTSVFTARRKSVERQIDRQSSLTHPSLSQLSGNYRKFLKR